MDQVKCLKTVSGKHLYNEFIKSGKYIICRCSEECTDLRDTYYHKCGACGIINDKQIIKEDE